MRQSAKTADRKGPAGRRQLSFEDMQAEIDALKAELAEAKAELQEAQGRETATAEVLGIISSSPGRLEPVFDAMLANAVRICGGTFGLLALRDGGGFRGVAAYGVGADVFPLTRLHHPPPGTGLAALQATKKTTQVADCAAEPAYDPVRALSPAFAGMRTALHVPMLKESELLGAIIVYRDQVAAVSKERNRARREFWETGGHCDRECATHH